MSTKPKKTVNKPVTVKDQSAALESIMKSGTVNSVSDEAPYHTLPDAGPNAEPDPITPTNTIFASVDLVDYIYFYVVKNKRRPPDCPIEPTRLCMSCEHLGYCRVRQRVQA